jgi:mycoredoxin
MANEKIIIYGTSWCGDSKRARLLLETNKIDFEWVDIEKDPAAAKLIEEINHGYRSVPTIVFPDGSTLTEPSSFELNKKLGLIS